jgi:hypothetical protein
MSQENLNARLITTSCTTGWADWVWGELWLLPQGLLRLPLGWKRAMGSARFVRKSGSAFGPTVAGTSPSAQFNLDEVPALVAQAKRSRWIPRDQLEEARLRRGMTADRLKVALVDGSRLKLLWLKRDPASDVLQLVLGEWLGSRLKLTGRKATGLSQ